MKHLKKLMNTAAATSAILFISNVSANSLNTEGGRITATAEGDLGTNISTVLNYFLGLLGLVATAFLIYAGVLMVTAGGNEEQVTKARKIIVYAVVGIIIVILSYSIVNFATGIFGN